MLACLVRARLCRSACETEKYTSALVLTSMTAVVTEFSTPNDLILTALTPYGVLSQSNVRSTQCSRAYSYQRELPFQDQTSTFPTNTALSGHAFLTPVTVLTCSAVSLVEHSEFPMESHCARTRCEWNNCPSSTRIVTGQIALHFNSFPRISLNLSASHVSTLQSQSRCIAFPP